LVSAPAARVVMGAAAPATAIEPQASPVEEKVVATDPQPVPVAADPQPVPVAANPTDLNALREAVVASVGGQRMLVSMLETGEWKIEGADLVIKVAATPTVIDMSVSPDARRTIIAAASGV